MSGSASSATPRADEPRRVAFLLLRAVDEDGAYANLRLPSLLAERGLSGRDAAFATELGYGTLRALGTLDEILADCVDRPLADLDPPVRDVLRLGAYQALRTRVPAHAAVASTVELTRVVGAGRASGLVNAVLRRVVRRDWSGWVEQLGAGRDPLSRLALRTAHPVWIAAAFADALGELDSSPGVQPAAQAGSELAGADRFPETAAALAADDVRPRTHLVARPGRIDRAELLAQTGGEPGPYSPLAVRMSGGNPADVPAIRSGAAGVQDEGSQLCALALSAAPLEGPDRRWLDLCAGPGGKAAVLAGLAAERGARLTANELREHRAELVRHAVARTSADVDVVVGDARRLERPAAGYDRVLLDAPCTGLGALRRRPEARWRRRPTDVPQLAELQGELLAVAVQLLRPGGLVAYVTCSPHPAETGRVVDTVVRAGDASVLDARALFPGVPLLGTRPTVQLWPHRHGCDAMFFALLTRT